MHAAGVVGVENSSDTAALREQIDVPEDGAAVEEFRLGWCEVGRRN